MKRVLLLSAALLVLSSCGGSEEDAAPETLVTYFEGGRVIMGDGSDPIEDAAIIVNDGVITGVGLASEVPHPAGAERYDLANHTVIPFMTNMHGHVGYMRGSSFGSHNYSPESVTTDLDRYLYYGVGAVAVLGTDLGETAFEVREQQRNGAAGGARLFTAGRGITANRGFPTTLEGLEDAPYEVGSEEAAREAVRELAAQQVDFIKVWVDDNRRVVGQVYRFGRLTDQFGTDPKLSPALYGAVIDEAHQNNIRVVAHVRYLEDAKSLVAAGIDGLVHSVRDRAVDQALIDAMIANNVFYVPTLTAHESAFVYADEPSWLGERSMRESVSGAVIGRLSSPGIVGAMQQDPNLSYRRQEFEVAVENLKTLFDAGVTIGFGTDSGGQNRFPGYFEHRELELMVDAGIPALAAIRIATSGAAELVGVSDLGSLEVGKRGHFIIVPGRPLDDIAATRDIAEVFTNGVRLERSTMMTSFTAN